MKRIPEMVFVMLAAEYGMPIERKSFMKHNAQWELVDKMGAIPWNWDKYDYRISPIFKDDNYNDTYIEYIKECSLSKKNFDLESDLELQEELNKLRNEPAKKPSENLPFRDLELELRKEIVTQQRPGGLLYNESASLSRLADLIESRKGFE